MSAPVLLITRPAPDAAKTAREVADRIAVRTIVSPVVERSDTGALWQGPPPDGLVLTSAGALATVASRTMPKGLPAWCVGDRTAEAARAAGFDAHSAAGDAEALVALILAASPGGQLLHLHGAQSRGDVAGRLAAAGQVCASLVVYRQEARALSDEARKALAGDEPVVLPLFSPFSARTVTDQGPFAAPLHLISLSPAVARVAPPGAETALTLPTPDGDAMIAAIIGKLQELIPRDGLLEGPPLPG